MRFPEMGGGMVLKGYSLFFSVRNRLLSRISRIASEERGATVAEYALVLVLVTVAVIGVLGQLGDTLRDKILDIVEELERLSS